MSEPDLQGTLTPHPESAFTNSESDVLLQVQDLHVEFRSRSGVVNAVNGLSYILEEGETLAILGESGSGKSVSAQAVMGILDSPPGHITGGRVLYRGKDLLKLPSRSMRRIRGRRIAMVFQDALTALNPVRTVGSQIGEMFRLHSGLSVTAARNRAIELLDRVHVPDAKARVDQYPHEFSGGMRQRAMIAMAIALDPDILIADEPTTALDVTVQAQIMELLGELQDQSGMGLILITHDLGVVAEVCDRVSVMYAGRVVESSPMESLFEEPRHPYTFGLMKSIPRADQKGTQLTPIKGQPPDLARIPSGCEFHPRCHLVQPLCIDQRPELFDVSRDRQSACHFHRALREDPRGEALSEGTP